MIQGKEEEEMVIRWHSQGPVETSSAFPTRSGVVPWTNIESITIVFT